MSVPEAYKEVVNDLVSMLENGTSNDVTITLMDGEIKANKDVLMARSNYFSSMLRNDSKYVESQSGIVNMSYVKKSNLEGIIYFLFGRQMDFEAYTIEQLVEMMNLTRMMSIDGLFRGIENQLLSNLRKKEAALEDVLKGYALAHRYSLDSTIEPFVNVTNMKLDNEKDSHLKFNMYIMDLTFDMIKTLFLTVDDKSQPAISSLKRLKRFKSWSKNSILMNEEDKKKILGTFDLKKFSEDQLVWISKLGLFTNSEVVRTLAATIKKIEDEKKDLQNWVTELEKKLSYKNQTSLQCQLKSDLIQKITDVQKEVADRRRSFV